MSLTDIIITNYKLLQIQNNTDSTIILIQHEINNIRSI